MAESLIISTGNKEDKYLVLLSQLNTILTANDYILSSMANICATLKMTFNFFWVGYYIVKDEVLFLGPFQGEIACTEIPISKGVCGHAFTKKTTVIVEDVDKFPGHIACSSSSKSEIVIPLIVNNKVVAVLDVDSDQFADFDDTDKFYLEKINRYLEELVKKRDQKLSLF